MIAFALAVQLAGAPVDPAHAAVGAAVGSAIVSAGGGAMMAGALFAKDDATAITLGTFGFFAIAGGFVGSGVGAAFGSGGDHVVDVGVAGLCGGLVGTLAGGAAGFGVLSAVGGNDPARALAIVGAGAGVGSAVGGAAGAAAMASQWSE